MFKSNDNHTQNSVFDTSAWMDPRIKKKLEKSWAPIFYEHVFCKIDEKPFAVLFSDTGRPNSPVNILLSLEYIKHIKENNDDELIDSFYFDYLVNYALGIKTLGAVNLAIRTLYYFRKRIYSYLLEHPEEEDLLFGQFIGLCKGFAKETGISFDEQRTDTTLFMSNIKKAGRLSLAYDVLIKTIKAVPEERLTDGLSKALGPNFKTNVLYHSKSSETDTKLTLLLNLCRDALAILKADPQLKDSGEARIAERFLSEQSIPDPEEYKVIPRSKKEITTDSLQSAYDEDATFRTKGKVSQSGYVLEISETCGEDNPFQLITDYAVAPNNTSDVEIIENRLEDIRENTGCKDMYVDGAFHSQEVHSLAKKIGVDIHLTNMTGKESSNKIAVTDFDIDPKTNLIRKCPENHKAKHAKVTNSQTSAHFTQCGSCPLRDRCYSKEQKKDYVVRIQIKAINTAVERTRMKENKVENTSKRAGIEGTNSALKRKGQGKLAVRGKHKVTMVSCFKVTAQNIKRLIKYKQGGYADKKATITIYGTAMPVTG